MWHAIAHQMNPVEVHRVDVKLLICHACTFFCSCRGESSFCRNPFNKQTEEADKGSSDDDDILSHLTRKMSCIICTKFNFNYLVTFDTELFSPEQTRR